MKILINPKHFKKEQFQTLINRLPQVTFTDDLDDLDIEGFITWGSAVKPKVLDRYQKLKLICLPSAGYDQVDVSYLKKRNIVLTNARGVYDIQIVEDVLSKILYLNRDMIRYQKAMNDHMWETEGKFFELYGSTVGIIGTGSIGQRLALIMKSFGTHTIGYRRKKEAVDGFDDIFYDAIGFEYLLSHSDYVILAVPLNDDTKYLMNEKAFKLMKKEALLINIARGDVIDQNALIKALNESWIRGAAIDVTSPEPLPKDDPLWEAKHVYISPHIAGRSPKAYERVNEKLSIIIKQYLEKKPIDNQIC